MSFFQIFWHEKQNLPFRQSTQTRRSSNRKTVKLKETVKNSLKLNKARSLRKKIYIFRKLFLWFRKDTVCLNGRQLPFPSFQLTDGSSFRIGSRR